LVIPTFADMGVGVQSGPISAQNFLTSTLTCLEGVYCPGDLQQQSWLHLQL
jgi:hypothetical protein